MFAFVLVGSALVANDASAQDAFDLDFGDEAEVEASLAQEAADSTEVDGEVLVENFSYLDDEEERRGRNSVDVQLRAETTQSGTSARASLLVRKDLADPGRDRFEALEAYVDVGKDKHRLRVGRSFRDVGSATLYSPADRITPADFTDLLDIEDRPAYMLWGRTELAGFGLEAIVLPVPESSIVPLPQAISPQGEVQSSNRWVRGRLPMPMMSAPIALQLLPPEEVEVSLKNSGLALRSSATAWGADLALGYTTQIGRVPHLVASMPGGNELFLQPVYEREHVVSFELARPIDRSRFALEAVAISPEGAREAFAIGVLSYDYLSREFFDDHSVNLVLEFTSTQPLEDGDLALDPLSRLDYLFSSAMLGRLEYRVGTEWKAKLLGIQTLDTLGLGRLKKRDGGWHDFMLHPEIETQLFGTVNASLGYQLFRGARHSLFGLYENNSRFTFSMSAAL
jgi:hypothetical protein